MRILEIKQRLDRMSETEDMAAKLYEAACADFYENAEDDIEYLLQEIKNYKAALKIMEKMGKEGMLK